MLRSTEYATPYIIMYKVTPDACTTEGDDPVTSELEEFILTPVTTGDNVDAVTGQIDISDATVVASADAISAILTAEFAVAATLRRLEDVDATPSDEL